MIEGLCKARPQGHREKGSKKTDLMTLDFCSLKAAIAVCFHFYTISSVKVSLFEQEIAAGA